MDGLHRIARTVAHASDPFAAVLSVTEETAKLFQAGLVAALISGKAWVGITWLCPTPRSGVMPNPFTPARCATLSVGSNRFAARASTS